MKKIISVEMAADNKIYEIICGGAIEVKSSDDGSFGIFVDNEEHDHRYSEQDAIEEAEKYMIDDRMIISGYGTSSGRKFWQLPDSVKNEIIQAAKKR